MTGVGVRPRFLHFAYKPTGNTTPVRQSDQLGSTRVGRAGAALFLVSIDRRGMTEPADLECRERHLKAFAALLDRLVLTPSRNAS